jgi:predicted nucleic acid-binding protein
VVKVGRPLVLANSGPLFVLFNASDKHHARALKYFQSHAPRTRFLTTSEVVSEVMYFLDFSADAQADFLEWLYLCHGNGSIDCNCRADG